MFEDDEDGGFSREDYDDLEMDLRRREARDQDE